ncbi:helical backbone metal receptor [Chitinophaga horti]|uniref:Helical backbone metal receptor n=1 Tax=Chitinophaga horti TaxID=2920382 RepID=A0ABY6JAF4_9BACT|nr:helical backbone metal receptor [Chitinophaga horti]UYQ95279.1 helical backbone metal receptor [Chitinophaga horti]
MANKTFTDQLGRKVGIPFPPTSIISLVPSQTELLFDLQLDAEVIGITKFCIHPDAWFRSKTRIGGTKQLHIEQIIELRPDLVIANKEENEKAQVEALMQHFPVWTSDIHDLAQACDMIEGIGRITDRATQAIALSQQIRQRFANLTPAEINMPAAYFIWREPWMVAGGDTFIHQMMLQCGFSNIYANHPRYPIADLDALKAAKVILLSSEPYPFKEKHIAEMQSYAPNARIILVDGEMFSWYGSRLLHAPNYFKELQATVTG